MKPVYSSCCFWLFITLLLMNDASYSGCPTPVSAPPTPVLPALSMFSQPTMGTWSMSTGVAIVCQPGGSVWCAGSDQLGELGDGLVALPFNSNNAWMQVLNASIFNVQQVDNGFNTNVVLRSDGSVWGWGDNWVGKIGDGTYALGGGLSPQPVPQRVIKSVAAGGGFLTNVVKVMSGDNCTVALTADHKVYAWGYNSGGQFGPSFTSYSYHPAAELLTYDGINPIDWAMDVECGDDFIVILRWNGTVWAMGNNSYGQLGTDNGGVGMSSAIPVGAYAPGVCTPLTGIKSISAGRRFVLAVDSSGNAYGWGLNNYGQTGTGNAGTDVYKPERILGSNCTGFLTNIIQVEAAGDAGYALSASGDVYSWGSDQNEELADGPGGTNRPCPMMVYSDVVEVAAGLYSVLVRKIDGSVCAAGNNWFGNFGLGGAFGCCSYIDVFTCVSIGVPLPVSLIAFEGKLTTGSIELNWITGSESNNAFFTLEKSSDGINFIECIKMKGAGNSNSIRNYHYPCFLPYTGINYFKLSQTDFDGKKCLLSVIAIDNSTQREHVILAPNPFTEKTNISLHITESKQVSVSLWDCKGKKIMDLVNGLLQEGLNEFPVYSGLLPPGIYLVKVISGTESSVLKAVLSDGN